MIYILILLKYCHACLILHSFRALDSLEKYFFIQTDWRKRSGIRVLHGRACSAIEAGVFTFYSVLAWGSLGEGICPRVAA